MILYMFYVCFLIQSTGLASLNLVKQTRYELSMTLSQAINAQILVGVSGKRILYRTRRMNQFSANMGMSVVFISQWG